MTADLMLQHIDAVLDRAVAAGVAWRETLCIRCVDGRCPLEVVDAKQRRVSAIDPDDVGLSRKEMNVVIMAADHPLGELRRRAKLSRDHDSYGLAVAVRERMLNRFGLQEGAA